MTTPNVEELITDLQQLANEIEISYRIEAIEEAVKVLQSQAERIKELEVDFVRLEATAQKFCVRNTFVEAERDELAADNARLRTLVISLTTDLDGVIDAAIKGGV